MPRISKRPPASVTPEKVWEWSSMLWRRTVEEGSGMPPASFTTMPVTLHEVGFAVSDAGRRACAAHDEAARNANRTMRAGFITFSTVQECETAELADYRVRRLRKAASSRRTPKEYRIRGLTWWDARSWAKGCLLA